ncbi:DNA methylase [Limimaricola soesokkakensis]|uniref:Methyltransferase n=1 Tax=Limimaricola soesokkakensis TaxID=1343159 RepID=A0A1X6Z8U9_9RHOB|nr:site-specific DNA-methyltransferase [Limimaricola soesokkakensis]PSK86580.1 DNA methylase [Limimaricola soesokkakensis]SLN43920.1 putative methyltransferase [Limimaricola soesokkakensis]
MCEKAKVDNFIQPMAEGAGNAEEGYRNPIDVERAITEPFTQTLIGDARKVPLEPGAADMVITSPPYWMKRDYGVDGQIGQEATPNEFVQNLIECMESWRAILPRWGSVFVNLGDTYHNGSLVNTPGRLEIAAHDAGWTIRNRIVWIKEAGMPDPAKDRLKSRHEYIIHFTPRRRGYYYDQFAYAEKYGNGTGPSDVWQIGFRRNMSKHLAPYPVELVDRILTLACPEQVCTCCGKPRERVVRRTAKLDPSRPQAKRAMELAKEKGLTPEHIAAIQATGISDAGKAMQVQTGTGRNSASVKSLAAEAKAALGGYFREFTFAKRETVGWTDCGCAGSFRPGIVLDPFMGTGTTLTAARAIGRSAIGVDLSSSH